MFGISGYFRLLSRCEKFRTTDILIESAKTNQEQRAENERKSERRVNNKHNLDGSHAWAGMWKIYIYNNHYFILSIITKQANIT